jgi:hypothetical protein
MAEGPLTLDNLREVAKFLQQMSDTDLKEKGFLLVQKKFPIFVNNLSRATDVASLVKYERQRRKSSL